jgi:hypothetical protein
MKDKSGEFPVRLVLHKESSDEKWVLGDAVGYNSLGDATRDGFEKAYFLVH